MELRDWIKKLIGDGRLKTVNYEDNPEIKNLRDQIDRFIAEKVRDDFESYFSTTISKEQSRKIMHWEQRMIENCFIVYFKLDLANVPKKQVELMRSEQWEKAELMDELRIKGRKFSPKKMERLAKLMCNSLVTNGSIQLGWLNEKLGIIKQDAELVFPEYANLRKKFGNFDQEVRLQDDGANNRGKGYVLNKDVAVKIKSPFGLIELKNKERYDVLLAGARIGENLGRTVLEKYAAEIFKKQLRSQASIKFVRIPTLVLDNRVALSKDGKTQNSEEHKQEMSR
mgnify:CR=1 FL=1|jgi:hypothetical protein